MKVHFTAEEYSIEKNCYVEVEQTVEAPFNAQCLDMDNVNNTKEIGMLIPYKAQELNNALSSLSWDIAKNTPFALADPDKTKFSFFIDWEDNTFKPVLTMTVQPYDWDRDSIDGGYVTEDAYLASVDFRNGYSDGSEFETYKIELDPQELKDFSWLVMDYLTNKVA